VSMTEPESPGLPPGVSPHLDVRLKSGWRFDRKRRAFVSADGGATSLKKLLPTGAKVVAKVPALADADPADLSDDEKTLASYFQVVLSSAADVADAAKALRTAEGVENVTAPPRVGLPNAPW
jgi:hypothetical protein